MSERDELSGEVHDAMFPMAYREDRMCWPRVVFRITDAILAAGYRKQEQQ